MIEDLLGRLKEAGAAAGMPKDFEQLNEYQKAAVMDHSKTLLVNAQVGSGKTTVLINKVLYLYFAKRIALQQMAVLTFTNKAAEEIKTRLKEQNLAISDEELKYFGTFHSVARNLLATVLPIEELGYTKAFTIADPDEMQEVYERVISENKLSVKYRNKLKKRLERYKQGRLLYGSMKQDDDMQDFYSLLRQEKQRCNIMEFDDLIENCIRLLPESSFYPKWIIVDEFQDCDSAQLEMLKHLGKGKSNMFVVGDPNQVIYSWRGSSLDIFKEFKERTGASEITLPLNYRSTTTILEAAKAFLGFDQQLSGVRESGSPIIIKKHFNTFNEALYICDRVRKLVAEGVAYRDIAVLYRKQKQSEVFRDVFKNQQIPYEVSIKKTIRDIPVLYWFIRLLKSAVNINDIDSLSFVLSDNRYGPGLGKKQLKETIKSISGDGCEAGQPLVQQIKGFSLWCGSVETENITAEAVYGYFCIDMYIAPTSLTYGEDRGIVIKFINNLLDYSRYMGFGLFNGVEEYLSKSALYGSQFINETIHQESESVKLMTLHASKGLEFKYVFISGANLGLLPIANCSPQEEEEEKRLFFVGITRAKDFLEISYHANPDDFGVYGVPSPFLRMIPQELIESEELGSRAAALGQLRKEIKANMDNGENSRMSGKAQEKLVEHDKYGRGRVISEDEENITVLFEVYGEKVFSKMFSTLKYI